ncbi:MAG: extracellular solute-binding protein [Chloroflexota bacterium]
MFKKKLFSIILTLVLTACASATPPPTVAPASAAAPSGSLVIYSGRSEALIKPVIEKFKAKYPAVTVALKAGSNSELANALIEETANPQADVFVATELMTLQSLADKGVFEGYKSANLKDVSSQYQHPDGLWTGLTLRARVIMYNTDLVKADDAPKSIFDLTNPKWKGQIAAAGSANGSLQAQVAEMRQLLGDEKAQKWLTDLKANEVKFFGGHTDVRKAVGAGEFKIGLVNHYYYHLQVAEKSKVAVIYPDQGKEELGLIVNATGAGLIKGAKNLNNAKAFVDYLLSAEGQEIFAQLNYEYPLRKDAPLHKDVAPLTNYRIAVFDVVKVGQSLNSTLTILEKAKIP